MSVEYGAVCWRWKWDAGRATGIPEYIDESTPVVSRVFFTECNGQFVVVGNCADPCSHDFSANIYRLWYVP